MYVPNLTEFVNICNKLTITHKTYGKYTIMGV